MMQGELLTLFYWLSAWGAALNCPAWARLFIRGLREPRAGHWWHEARLLVRAGLSLLSFGVAGLAGVRLGAALLEQVMIQVPSPAGVVFIGVMAAAEPLFLRVDELHAKASGKRSVAWRLYWAGAIGGVVGTIIYAAVRAA